jgi:hypothetical protein
MTWRILLTASYTATLGTLFCLENFNPGMSSVPLVVALLAAPVVAYLVGHWWVMIALVGALVGRAIGWDAGENDGNSVFWWPYVLTTIIFVSAPLLLGLALSFSVPLRRNRR